MGSYGCRGTCFYAIVFFEFVMLVAWEPGMFFFCREVLLLKMVAVDNIVNLLHFCLDVVLAFSQYYSRDV